MKLRDSFFILFLCSIPIFNANSKVRLVAPETLEMEQLNQSQQKKIKNIDYSETIETSNQYKGKLKKTEGVEEVRLNDVRLYLGFGGRATFANDATIKKEGYDDINLNFDSDMNYFGSVGLYWRNGIRTEFEYSSTAIRGDATTPSGFMDSDGNISEKIKINFEIDTYMWNFMFEKTHAKTPIKPYIGFGLGVASGDFEGLVTDGGALAPAAQFMVGLSYPISKDVVSFYLGYRAFFTGKMEQDFSMSRLISGSSPSAYETIQVKKSYYYQTHNVDFGIRFFF